jgi:hypothetical protein
MKLYCAIAGFLTFATVAMANDLPTPPFPPEHPPSSSLAPVPNLDAHAPLVAESIGPKVNVRLFHHRTYETSMGFAPGSEYRSSDSRRLLPAPGFSVDVPLR